jgi:ABC-type transporter Mla subunit MlaD
MTDETLLPPTPDPTAAAGSPLAVSSEIGPADLQAARRRRAGLRRLCRHLGEALASTDARAPDHEAVARALSELAECWSRHVADTEAPDGLLNQILTDAPRLATTVERFRREHPAITARIVATADRLADRAADRTDVEQHVAGLLATIERHRRGGGELIHSAYNIDIGLGE